jgi:hypothetical protein
MTTRFEARREALRERRNPVEKIPRRCKVSQMLRPMPKRVAFGADTEAVARLRLRYNRGWKRTRWCPHRTLEAERRKATTLLEEHAPPDKTAKRICDFVETFMIINHFQSLEQACDELFAQMLRDGLCAKTVTNYLKMAEDEFGGVGPRFRRVIKVLGLLASDDDSQHAPDRTAEQCLQLLKKMMKKAPRAAVICELILKSGLRCKDITRLRTRLVVWTKTKLKIRVRVAKNIRNPSESVVTRIPLWFGNPTRLLTKMMKEGEKPFAGDSVGRVLRAIRLIDDEVTTYTFRRCFMHKALKECDFDFNLCVSRYTLHKQVKTLRAYYDSLHLDDEE